MLIVATTKNNMRALLKRRGLTSYQVADKWGKHKQYVYQLETCPNLDKVQGKTLVELANILRCSVDELLGRNGYNGK